MFKKICASICAFAMLLPSLAVGNAANLRNARLLHENYEGSTFAYPTSTNDTRLVEENDGVNTTRYINHISPTGSHWMQMEKSADGVVVYELRAKYNETYRFGFGKIVTRDGGSGETWSRTAEIRIDDTSWKYYRIFVDYESRSVTAFSAEDGFENLEPVSLTVDFGRDSSGNYAQGMKSFTINNLAFDDFSIYENPNSGDWVSSIDDGEENISVNPEIKISYFSLLDSTSVENGSVVFESENGETVPAECEYKSSGLIVSPSEPLVSGARYTLKINGAKNTDGEDMDNVELAFKTAEYRAEEILRLNSAVFPTSDGEENDIDLISGDTAYKFNVTNLTNENAEFTVITALYRTFGGKIDFMESFVKNEYSLAAEETSDFETDVFNIPEHSKGEYAVRVFFIENGSNKPCLGALEYNASDNKRQAEGTTAFLDIERSEYDAESGTFEITAGKKAASGRRVTYALISPQNQLVYIGQEALTSSGGFSKKFHLPENFSQGTYTLAAKCEEESPVLTTIDADSSGCIPICYEVKIDGEISAGNTVSAKYSIYGATESISIVWECADTQNGNYTQFGQGGRTEITTAQTDKYIRFRILNGEQVICTSDGYKVSSSQTPDKVRTYLETSFDDGSTYWQSAERVSGDGENNTVFAKTNAGATAGYVTLNSEANQTVIMQFRAKSLGQGYFTISTRQNSNYQKTINYTNNNVTQIGKWGCYRLVLDCEKGEGTVYYSASSFTEMERISGSVVFSNANGFNMVTFQNCCIDDIKIMAQPAPGAFTCEITDGAEVIFYSPMDSATFNEENIAVYSKEDGQNVTSLQNVGQFGFKAVPTYEVIYDRSYRLVMNGNIALSDSTAVSAKSFDFEIGEEPEYNLLRLTDEKLKVNGEDSSNVAPGENSVEFNLTNISGLELNAAVTLVLYKNTNGADYTVETVCTNVTVAAGAVNQSVKTGMVTVPESEIGDYALRVFVGTDEKPYDTITKALEFDANAVQPLKNSNLYARKYKVSLDSPTVDYENGIINIAGNVHSGKNKRVIVLIKDSPGKTEYIGYTKSAYENGSFSLSSVISPDISDGIHIVEAYAEKTAQKAETQFSTDKSKIKPLAMNVKINGSCAALEKVDVKYTYYHPLNVQMESAEFAWYISDTENGTYQKAGDTESYEIKEEDSAKYLKCSVKVSDGTAVSAETFSAPMRVTAKPVASKLSIQGTRRAGSRVYAAYEYYHADNLPQEKSQVEWYISDAENGTYQSIGTAEYLELTADMVGKFVKYSVIPSSSSGTGMKKISDPFRVLEKETSSGGGDGSGSSKATVGDVAISTNIKNDDKNTSGDTAGFSDMQGHWAKNIVNTLKNKGIISGKSESEFAPDESICRGDFALLLAKIGNLKAEKSYDFKDVDKSDYYYAAIAALYDKEIIKGYDGYIRPADPITREEVAAIAVRYAQALNLIMQSGGSTDFTDGNNVSEWAEESVKSAALMGIMIGDNENRFNPQSMLSRAESAVIIYRLSGEQSDTNGKYAVGSSLSEKLGLVKANALFAQGTASKDDFKNVMAQIGGDYKGSGSDPVTMGEAAEYATELLGYGELAQVNGGYFKYADRLELFKNMGKVSQNEELTPAQLMQLTDNILLARVYVMKGVDNEKTLYGQEGTYLYERFSITKTEGILSATDRSSIEGAYCLDENFIEIDNERYKTKFDCAELLGYRVEAYYDNENEIMLYVEAMANKNKVFKLDARDVDEITKNSIRYTSKGTNSSKKQSVSDYMPVLLNNTFCGYLNTVDTESITPERGSVTLIDNNNDGKYDCLSIVKYDLYVADRVNKAKHFITFKNADTGLQFQNDDENIVCTIRHDGEIIDFGDIKEWDVLAVLFSDNANGNKYYDINVIRRTITGEFSGITDDSVFIDNREYDLLDEFDKKQILTGKEYTFLFAGDDDIIWYKDADSYRYAYVLRAWEKEMEEHYQLKIINDKGNAEIIDLAERLKYNGNSKNAEDVYGELTNTDGETMQQLIKYCLNDDKTVRSVYTVLTEYTDAEEPDRDVFFSKTEKASRYEHINTYAFLYSMAPGATTFFIKGDDDVLTEDNISVGTMSGTSDSSYVCEFFDVDEIGQAKAAIFYRENSSLSDTVPQACFVDKVNKGIDDNGNSGTFISYYYYFDGTYNRVFVETDKKESNAGFYLYPSDSGITGVDDLERGDIIQVAKNNEGSITSFRVLYDRSADNPYGTILRSTNDNAPRIEVIYSPVYNIDDSKIKVKGKDGNMRVYDISESSKYFKAYRLNRKEKTLAPADYSDILSVRDTGSEDEASKVVLIAQSGYVRCIMIEDEI